ncbi:MAG: HEAT repeat protein [Planctomycetota bacterium]|jgi:HEAT repeat protein
MTRPRPIAIAGWLTVMTMLVGCTKDAAANPGSERLSLPKLVLRPMLKELQTLAATHKAPEAKVQKELRDYADITLRLVRADARTENLVERSLLAHNDAWFVLEPALAHDDAAVRQRAAWLCGQSGQTVLQIPLLLRLKYELNPVTVIWVADALLKLGNDSGLLHLGYAFRRELTANQAGLMAMQALAARGVNVPKDPDWNALTTLLTEQADKWRKIGKSGLATVAAPAKQQFMARLAHQLQTPEGTQLRPVDDARFILTRLGALGVPMVASVLQAEEHYLRSMPLQVLTELGAAARSATDAIVPLLGDPLTCMYAVRALGEIGATETLPHLRPLLGSRDTELRAQATQALGLLGDGQSRAALEARLQDANETMDVRVGAAFGLLCLGDHAVASAYLAEREANLDYHEPTLTRLRERLSGRAR